jgi:starch synthase
LSNKRILLVAAENDALPGGKVGGVADVVRDLPVALANHGWEPTVLTPAYGVFDLLPGARWLKNIATHFAGSIQRASLWQVPGPDPRIRHLTIEHHILSPQGTGKIYCDDGADRPFATDATKFAFFCAAVAGFVRDDSLIPDVIHLHDWHTGLYLVLREYQAEFASLQNIRTVFTIHNLAIQGIRPFANDISSLQAWFPYQRFPQEQLVDPRYSNCLNPMAAAIRLADGVSTVSPTYAAEIMRPSNPEHGFIGGEGLEADLQLAFKQGRLTGILNGCDYPTESKRRPGWARLLAAAKEQVAGWTAGSYTRETHTNAAERLAGISKRRPANVLVSVGRLTAQKVALLLQTTSDGRTALDVILDDLGRTGVLLLLGSGDANIERRISAIAARHTNLLFLCGYSDKLAQMFYKAGDLFLMPSSFEPCGISQMLAMRAGQPCVVHEVGGLKDTVSDGLNGFSFAGDWPAVQADNFIATVRRALKLKAGKPERWAKLKAQAAATRFSWDTAAISYEKNLYESTGN